MLYTVSFTISLKYVFSQFVVDWKITLKCGSVCEWSWSIVHTFFLSLIDPFPRTIILQPVSCSNCLAVIPLGPRILPTKLNWKEKREKLLIYYSQKIYNFNPRNNSARWGNNRTIWNIIHVIKFQSIKRNHLFECNCIAKCMVFTLR